MRRSESGERIEEGFLSDDPRDFAGPPYMVAEHVFDEYDIEGCYTTADEVSAPDVCLEEGVQAMEEQVKCHMMPCPGLIPTLAPGRGHLREAPRAYAVIAGAVAAVHAPAGPGCPAVAPSLVREETVVREVRESLDTPSALVGKIGKARPILLRRR